ncbi:hypothetical protein PPL_10768 [Heterostelium album PN500]|uniref:Uncharacterized protein n=1 Tax=Heterostelium pallidum (strain ATCC 26659 / Pp 5 / PN500) TaxID=670386 RepID=D3BRX8_HETP5|nr:hypothetical protein PPL_10768 [Heterostelium album PN500]EFA75715.1 hypothetical protein PPL_10768 [Heterostelium album PN500]|eukprot:XP_020427849.1 hypothetical protein PPL_10768 [Heterostelium album PN500]
MADKVTTTFDPTSIIKHITSFKTYNDNVEETNENNNQISSGEILWEMSSSTSFTQLFYENNLVDISILHLESFIIFKTNNNNNNNNSNNDEDDTIIIENQTRLIEISIAITNLLVISTKILQTLNILFYHSTLTDRIAMINFGIASAFKDILDNKDLDNFYSTSMIEEILESIMRFIDTKEEDCEQDRIVEFKELYSDSFNCLSETILEIFYSAVKEDEPSLISQTISLLTTDLLSIDIVYLNSVEFWNTLLSLDLSNIDASKEVVTLLNNLTTSDNLDVDVILLISNHFSSLFDLLLSDDQCDQSTLDMLNRFKIIFIDTLKLVDSEENQPSVTTTSSSSSLTSSTTCDSNNRNKLIENIDLIQSIKIENN